MQGLALASSGRCLATLGVIRFAKSASNFVRATKCVLKQPSARLKVRYWGVYNFSVRSAAKTISGELPCPPPVDKRSASYAAPPRQACQFPNDPASLQYWEEKAIFDLPGAPPMHIEQAPCRECVVGPS